MELKSDGTTNYVDNKEFLRLITERRELVQKANKADKPKPRVSEALGKIILDIATNLSYRRNFINYNFREEMIGDGIENCLLYIDNFDPEKSKNPFAYFTQICFYAFVRRITKETKQWETKKKMIERAGVDWEAYARNDFDFDENFFNDPPPEKK